MLPQTKISLGQLYTEMRMPLRYRVIGMHSVSTKPSGPTNTGIWPRGLISSNFLRLSPMWSTCTRSSFKPCALAIAMMAKTRGLAYANTTLWPVSNVRISLFKGIRPRLGMACGTLTFCVYSVPNAILYLKYTLCRFVGYLQLDHVCLGQAEWSYIHAFGKIPSKKRPRS